MKKAVKILGYAVLIFIGLFFILCIYLYNVAIESPPKIKNERALRLDRKTLDANCYTIGNNWIRKSNSGLWEMYIEGAPFDRGVINGKLAQELIQKQEDAFSAQIEKIVPSKTYRSFLKYFVGWFNRDLAKNISEEYKEEIYGVSLAASDKYDYIGSNYQRILNYHAAHDIGHALQNLALVGCSSFATWNNRSQDSLLIIGRNFDFYVGDKFAEDKIAEFVNPDSGFKFMMITWGGFCGVVSGMNMEGLTVTINAAKSDVPSGSATPISLLSREILQYAKNIDDAVRIAKSRKTFVSESLLIGSSNDNKAVIIEKTPLQIDVHDPNENFITCTNHYQSKALENSKQNEDFKMLSASVYRYNRLTELMNKYPTNTPQSTAAILRDQLGIHNKQIGWGNEKALNQLIAHHSVIFEPQKKIVWISTSPWQLGKYVAYDLNKIFSMQGLQVNHELCDSVLNIPADTFLNTSYFTNFLEFRKLKQLAMDNKAIDADALVKSNPDYYDSYVLAGDYEFKNGDFSKAKSFYETALTKEIATIPEKKHIEDQLKKCIEKLK